MVEKSIEQIRAELRKDMPPEQIEKSELLADCCVYLFGLPFDQLKEKARLLEF
jgi:hypothetical protein